MGQEFSNWSGSMRFTPGRRAAPKNEEELAALVRRAAEEKTSVRPVGAGHSSQPLVATDGILVSLEHFKGLDSPDTKAREAGIRAGMMLKEAGKTLLDADLAMENLGDVDYQALVGAVGTGTHGTGKRLKILSAHLVGVRLVTGTGEILQLSFDQDPDFIRAAKVSLGVLGIFTSVRLRLLPAYRLHRRECCTHIDDCTANLESLVEENRNFDFYWYPRSDLARIRTMNPPGEGMDDISFARCLREKERQGWSSEVIPRERHLKFDEMEYSLPAEAGPACFQEVRKRVKEKHRKYVCWRVLYRTVAADDGFLSHCTGRDTATISLHQNNTLPFQEYFDDIEPIFRAYGGRPHWAKKHSLSAKELEPLYPMWSRFLEIRRKMDPDGVLLNPYLRDLLGIG